MCIISFPKTRGDTQLKFCAFHMTALQTFVFCNYKYDVRHMYTLLYSSDGRARPSALHVCATAQPGLGGLNGHVLPDGFLGP